MNISKFIQVFNKSIIWNVILTFIVSTIFTLIEYFYTHPDIRTFAGGTFVGDTNIFIRFFLYYGFSFAICTLSFYALEVVINKRVTFSLSNELLNVNPKYLLVDVPIDSYKYIEHIIEKRISDDLKKIKSYRGGLNFDVESHDLYKYIISSFNDTKNIDFKIIDHDIRRWIELLSKAENQVFNDTKKIFYSTKSRAKNDDFKLERILIIEQKEWKALANCLNPKEDNCIGCDFFESCKKFDNVSTKDDKDDKDKIRKVIQELSKVEKQLYDKLGRKPIETKICVADWLHLEKDEIYNQLIKIQDVVIVNKKAIFRENITIENRNPSNEYRGNVSCSVLDIKKSLDLFNNLWNNHALLIFQQKSELK